MPKPSFQRDRHDWPAIPGAVAAYALDPQALNESGENRTSAARVLTQSALKPKTDIKKITVLDRHVSQLGVDHNLCQQWDLLYREAANQSIFLSRDWIEAWLEIYGAHFDQHWIWWTKDGLMVGACLLLRKKVRVKTFTLDTLFLNTTDVTPERSPVAEFNDVLCLPGSEEAVAADLVALLSEFKWDRLVVGGYLNGSVISRVVAAIGAYRTETESKPAPYVNLQQLTPVPFSEQLTKSVGSQIRRCRRIYEERFGPVSITSMPTLAAAIACFDHLADLHNTRWQKKGQQGSFSNRSAVQFHHRLISRLWPRAQVELIWVKAGEQSVGLLYNFINSGKVYFFQSGFEYDNDNRLKPGLLTHALAIDRCRTRGLQEYDFLAGDSQYKRSLAKNQRLLYWTTVYRDSGSVKLFIKCRQAKVMLAKMKEYLGAKSVRAGG